MPESTPEQDKAQVVQNLRGQLTRMSSLVDELEAFDPEEITECVKVFEKLALEADNLFEKSASTCVVAATFARLVGDDDDDE